MERTSGEEHNGARELDMHRIEFKKWNFEFKKNLNFMEFLGHEDGLQKSRLSATS